MSAYLSKYNLGLDGKGYVVSQKNGVRQYQKRRSPTFVSKYGGGDVSYRDATFWQYFVQTNWRNGAKQLKWDDAGKFWKSSDVNTTILEELTLSNSFSSAGIMIASGKVNVMAAWRSSASWWDANYGYRQQLTITNGSASTAPIGYPIKVTIDTAALQTAVKVRSDRKDWRIVYFNGSAWVDLSRDYISTTSTFFALQATIASGSSDSNYYAYYGYAAESTTKQPSTEANWNAVYGMYGVTPDSDSKAIFHMEEGSGTTVADDSSSSNTGTLSGGPSWGTDGKFGRYITLVSASSQYMSLANLGLGSFTMEAWIYPTSAAGDTTIFSQANNAGTTFSFEVHVTANQIRYTQDGYSDLDAGTISNNTWYHIAVTNDGSTVKIFVDGVQVGSSSRAALSASSDSYYVGVGHSSGFTRYFAGRIQHARFSDTARTSFPYTLSAEPSISAGSETTTQPPSSTFDVYGGGSDGKVYKWDGTITWTEQFDCRRLIWFDTTSDKDTDKIVGDTGGTETAQSQGFQLTYGQTISGAQMYLKKSAGTPGNITVRIETNNAGVPSGTLANSSATGTITAFTTSSYDWVEVTFAGTFTLPASTTYHLVLKTAAAANDQNYSWGADGSSPTFSSGAMSASTDGGTTWSAVAAADGLFRLLGQATEVNCMKVTSIGGTQKLYIGTGLSTGQTNGDARLYSYDGTSWLLNYSFTTATESMILSIEEYTANSKVYVGVGPQAKIYESSNMSAYTLSKDINIPQNPGYPHTMKEYNRVLHVGGGSPEFLPTQNYNGFLSVYDTTAWNTLYPFDFTVIKSLEFYDAYLFMGTYRGDLYVYDTASLNPLFNFKDQYNYQVEIKTMKYYNDKLYIGLYPQSGSNETNVGIWLFDRRGLSLAHTISGVTGYRCFEVVNGLLMVGTGNSGYVYKIDLNSYKTTGNYDSSYFDANLPSINKLYNQVTIRHDPLATGQSIVVYYKFKESDSWTLLGTSNTVSATEKSFSFDIGTYSKKIALRCVLNTTDTTATPKLTETILQYSLYPERKWQWTFRVKAKTNLRLLDASFESRTATEIRTDLEDLLSTQQLFLFTDIDGTTYTVLTHDIDQASWVVNQLNGDIPEDEVIITLLEA